MKAESRIRKLLFVIKKITENYHEEDFFCCCFARKKIMYLKVLKNMK